MGFQWVHRCDDFQSILHDTMLMSPIFLPLGSGADLCFIKLRSSRQFWLNDCGMIEEWVWGSLKTVFVGPECRYATRTHRWGFVLPTDVSCKEILVYSIWLTGTLTLTPNDHPSDLPLVTEFCIDAPTPAFRFDFKWKICFNRSGWLTHTYQLTRKLVTSYEYTDDWLRWLSTQACVSHTMARYIYNVTHNEHITNVLL